MTDINTELFDYHSPTPEMVEQITQVREGCKALYLVLMEQVPACAERTLAIRKLEEVSMWSNKAVVFDGKPYLQVPRP